MNRTPSTADLFRQLIERRAGGIGSLLEELARRPDFPAFALDVLKTGDEAAKIMALVVLRGLNGQTIWDAALAALEDRSPRVRRLAVQRLASAPASIGWSALQAALNNDVDTHVKQEALAALASLNSPEFVELLRTRLLAPDAADRKAAWSVIQARGLSNFWREASQALYDENDEVRRYALLVLSLQVVNAPLEPLVHLLDDPSTAIRSLALTVLRRKGDPRACPPITRLLDDPVPLLRRLALVTLGELGCKEPLERLIGQGDQFTSETDKALWITTLGKLGDQGLGYLIRPYLQDASPLIRRAAINAYLPWWSNEASLLFLHQTIQQDTSPLVRATALSSLGMIGGEKAQKILTEVLQKEQDASLRRVAANALARMANGSSVTALRACLQDADAEVRATAIRSLGQLQITKAIADLQALKQRESNLSALAEIQAALNRIDPAIFALPPDVQAAAVFFDPWQQGKAFTVWLRDPTWYPVSERLVFYNTGDLEAIDLEEETQHYRYTCEPGQLQLLRTGDQKEFVCPFTIQIAIWEHGPSGPQPCYCLQLDNILLFRRTEPERFIFYTNAARGIDQGSPS